MDELVRNDQVIQGLTLAIEKGGIDLEQVPMLLKKIIKEEMWRHRKLTYADNRLVDYERDQFALFVTTPPPEGLGTTCEFLFKMCADDPVALNLLDRATQGKWGGDRKSEEIKVDNVHLDLPERPSGNSRQRSLRKLRKGAENSETVRALYNMVLAGEISPHAAMVEAGLRRRRISIPLEIEGAARLIARHFDGDLPKLVEKLQEHIREHALREAV